MTSPIDRIRQVALALPETEERPVDGGSGFFVMGTSFAQVRGDRLVLAGAETADRATIDLAGEVDWTLVEDRLAHSWELAAPQGLLEAGGR